MASTAKLIRLDFEVFGKVQGNNTILDFEIVICIKIWFSTVISGVFFRKVSLSLFAWNKTQLEVVLHKSSEHWKKI